ncbi:excisionase family DNA binding domain-containing protein [Propionibacterium sp. oral taxon 192 str. F0372]|uniref:excisionase family DNA-binding protein n=1 Tax=Propionibacterium sp. oral taxon 192 TaxID=671222 RepID=UPI0003544117|nr:excisionase family DNA-binding protein [Propionibacterium sp. oral taxon 192]EPH07069.1 excisionase family DNA binding domain-containing protein [Propionibacterium sp. oral taxon 192 str. F0372]
MAELWLSADDIATHLGSTKATVYTWIAEKAMPAHKVGRLWKLQASENDAWNGFAAAVREAAARQSKADGKDVGLIDIAWAPQPATDSDEPSPIEFALEAALTRFFGSVKIDPDRYSRDIGNVTREVIDRLAGASAHLEITIDIQAVKPEGFDESEIRTISENAHVLKFDPSSGFEES